MEKRGLASPDRPLGRLARFVEKTFSNMTTMLTTRLSHDAEQLLLAVDALFPEDAERVRSWVGRRIVNGDFAGRLIDGKLLRHAASKWPDPLFRQALESAARFMERGDELYGARLRRAVA